MNNALRRICLCALLSGLFSAGHADPQFSVETSPTARATFTSNAYGIQPNTALQVTVTNVGDQAATAVAGEVISLDPDVVVVRNKIFVGNLSVAAAGTAKETIALYVKSGASFTPADLSWTFSYDEALDDSTPTADAGDDRTAFVAETVMLNGSGSSDLDGDPIDYFWRYVSRPAGSTATFSNTRAILPTFTVDQPGVYVIELNVRARGFDGTGDTVVVSTINSPPVAKAGIDQATTAGNPVQLDGSASSDIDGDVLTFDWQLLSVPPGSAAVLDDSTAVAPAFFADLPGDYSAQLVVNDGAVDSAADRVDIVTPPTNTPPVANAGPDIADIVANTVLLDGSGSSDADNDALTFNWSLVALPAGSGAALSNAGSAIASFVPDVEGQYVAQLIVDDGQDSSAPDSALATIVVGNTPPVAIVSPDQIVDAGDTVALDGSASNDVDGDGLVFDWSLTTLPADSVAALDDPNVISPSFDADKKGIYVAQLVVNDGLIPGDPATSTITVLNTPPVADAGTDDSGFRGDLISLDGSGSSDAEDNPLTYQWAIISRPGGSTAALSGVDTVSPSFTIDGVGIYEIRLIVNDNNDDSLPDTVLVTGINRDPIANTDSDTTLEDNALDILVLGNDSDPDGDGFTLNGLTQPANGTAAINGDAITYTPDPDYFGADSFTYTIIDDYAGISAPATVNITVDPVNDAPTITSVNDVNILEDAVLQTVNFGGIGTGAANEVQSIGITAVSSNPALIPNPVVNYTSPSAAGSIEFTPLADQFGTTTITLTITDDGGTPNGGDDTTVETFDIVVAPVNDEPTLSPISDVTVWEDSGTGTVNFDGITTGKPNETQVLTVTSTSSDPSIIPHPPVTYVSPGGAGSLDFTPGPDEFGLVTITVTVTDDGGTPNGGDDAVSQTFDIDVLPVNDAPEVDAVADKTVYEDLGPWSIPLTGINEGAYNETDQTIIVTAVSADTDLLPTVTVDYTDPQTPAFINIDSGPDYYGVTTITVTLMDDGGTERNGEDTTIIQFEFDVLPVNDAPDIDPLSDLTIDEDDPLFAVNLQNIGTGAFNEVQVLSVTAVSSDPTIVPNPTVNYADPDSDGQVNINPGADQFGSVTISVTVTDDGGTPNGGVDFTTRTFDITIDPVNDEPTIDFVPEQNILEDAAEQIVNLTGITSGAANENQTLTVTAVTNTPSQVPNPILTYTSPDSTGSFAYTPVPDATGLATITVMVDDDGGTGNGGDNSFARNIVINIEAVNDDPVGLTDSPSVDEDTTDNPLDVLGNDTDVDIGDSLTVDSVTQPANGAVTNNSSNVLYTPDPDYFGLDTFTYVATDGNGGFTNAVTVNVTVNNINDPPTAVDDPLPSTTEDVPVDIPVLANDTDPENDTLSIISVTVPTSGTTQNNGTTVTYTPAPNFSGVDAFVYTMSDGNGGTDSATVTVTVIGVNDPPTAVDDDYTIDEDEAIVFPVLSNDFDVDFDGISISNVTPGTLGAAVSGGGGIMYTPNPNVSGNDTIGYTITDGNGEFDSATVTVEILPVNDIPVAEAGPDQNVEIPVDVTLDGSGSFDIDGPSAITYSWSMTSRPGGSAAALSGSTTVDPTFSPDVAGDYVIRLITNDGLANSVADTMTVTATSVPPTILTLTPPSVGIATFGSTALTVTLNEPALVGGQLVSLSSNNVAVTVPASVTVPQGELFTTFDATSGVDTGSATVSASATGLVGDSSGVTVTARTFSVVIPLVGIERTVTADLTLPQPAPAGGATFDLSVLDPGIATVSDTSVTILEGESAATFDVTGGQTAGPTSVSVDGTVSGYESQSIPITVTDRLIDMPTSETLAFNESRDLLVLIAPDPAPPGGLIIDAVSSNPSIVQVITPSVVIPEGALSAAITVQADATLSGSVDITASNAGFSSDSTLVTVTRGLNILESSESFGSAETEEVFFQISSGGSPFPAGPGGVSVDVSSDDTSCVVVTTPEVIAEGSDFASSTLSYGGVASLPCTATVTAQNPVFGADSVPVTIDDAADIGNFSFVVNNNSYISQARLGSGLQRPFRMNLSTGSHGGVTIQVQSNSTELLRLATDAFTPGLPSIEVFIPDGSTGATLYAQGVRGATGSATLTASHPLFTEGGASIEVVPAAFNMFGEIVNTNTLAADDDFGVSTYTLNVGGTGLQQQQQVSAEGPLTVTITSSDPAVATLTTTAQPMTSPVTVTIPVNGTQSPGSVGAGGAAIDALTGGTTRISPTAPGFDPSFAGGFADVTVSQPGMSFVINNNSYISQGRLGSGLQRPIRLNLDGADHGGVTVRVTSSDQGILRLAPDAFTPGSEFIDLFFADGTSGITLYAQGVRGATGSATVTATQALFTDGVGNIEVVPAAFNMFGEIVNTNTLAADDDFGVSTYTLNVGGTGLQQQQQVSAEGPLTVTITSSDPAVATLTTTAQPMTSPVTVTIPVNGTQSPGSVGAGGAAIDALTGGTTRISPTAPGFDPSFAGGFADVTVSQPGMSFVINNNSYISQGRLGSGLQRPIRLNLDGADHGGVTVRVTSSDQGILRLAPDAFTPGSEFIDLFFADGTSGITLYAQGVRGATGSATVTATQALFTDGVGNIEVVPAAFNMFGEIVNTNTLAADDDFGVSTYTLNVGGTGLQQQQQVSAEGPLTVTITSSDPAVATLTTTAQPMTSPVTVTIPVNGTQSPGSVGAGGAAIDALTGGTTRISPTAPGFDPSFAGGFADVTVSQPGMSFVINNNSYISQGRLGSGLQRPIRLNLDGADHGGVTVRVTSSDQGILRLAPDAFTPGSEFIDLFFADGTSGITLYAQGVRGATGSATVTATQALFTDGVGNIEVVPAAFNMFGEIVNTNTLAADDDFGVSTYTLNVGGTGLQQQQQVSAEGPLTVTITSSDPAVATLTTTAQPMTSPVTVTIPVNGTQSPGSVGAGGAAIDALTGGTTRISPTAPGFDPSFAGGFADVTVSQPGMSFVINNNSYISQGRLGSGLQRPIRLNLDGADHGGVTVRVASSDPAIALIAADAVTPGTSFIDVFIADGLTGITIYVQAVRGATGNVTITGSNVLFTDGVGFVEVVPAAFVISSLAASTTAGAADDPFTINTASANVAGTGIQQYQQVSAAGPLTVNVTSSNTSVGALTTASQTATSPVTADIPINVTALTNQVWFDAITDGVTTISISAPGFDPGVPNSSVDVTVDP